MSVRDSNSYLSKYSFVPTALLLLFTIFPQIILYESSTVSDKEVGYWVGIKKNAQGNTSCKLGRKILNLELSSPKSIFFLSQHTSSPEKWQLNFHSKNFLR